MFSFIKAELNDIPHIQDIARKTWPGAYGNILQQEQITYMLNLMYSTESLTQQFEEGVFFYLIYSDEVLAGFAAIGFLPNEIAKLHKIYVYPQFQGSGAGSALLDFAINKALSLGASRLTLNVNRRNKAKSWYEKNGFVVTAEKNIDIGGGFFMNDYIMSLQL